MEIDLVPEGTHKDGCSTRRQDHSKRTVAHPPRSYRSRLLLVIVDTMVNSEIRRSLGSELGRW
jgi:hypothetical protein